MKIVIVGSGSVGVTLAEKLSRESHDVVLVESDSARVRLLQDELDVQVVEGNGATAGVLRQAGVERASLVVATTDSDEVNFLAGQLAVSLFHAEHVVVRLRDRKHEEAFAALFRDAAEGVVCVNPEAAAVDKIASLLELPGALDLTSFLDEQLLVAGFRIGAGSEFTDRPVSDMRLFFAETPTLVAAIQRGDRAIVPHGAELIQAGDLVYFAIARDDLEGVLQLLGARRESSHHVTIAGATPVGMALARKLEGSGPRVKLIEADVDLARRAADTLEETRVVHGVVTHAKLLDEEEIERVSTFVAVTPDYETNLVAGLLAKRMGARRAFALVDNPGLANLIGDTGIDAVISPRLLAIGLMLQHIPGARLHSMAALLGDRVELMEAEVEKGSRITAGRLDAIALPRGVLVVALQRGGALRVPRGDDAVQAGDRILLVAATEKVGKAADFLAS